jgi:hypothetical protein
MDERERARSRIVKRLEQEVRQDTGERDDPEWFQKDGGELFGKDPFDKDTDIFDKNGDIFGKGPSPEPEPDTFDKNGDIFIKGPED